MYNIPEFELKVINPIIEEKNYYPFFATPNSAGMDIRSCEDFEINPNETYELRTGFAIWINDPSYALLIIPRSGLGSRTGIILGNLTGLIDADYQGDIIVTLWNRSNEKYVCKQGDRVAQMFFPRIVQPTFKYVSEFSGVTVRGVGGLGHTGV